MAADSWRFLRQGGHTAGAVEIPSSVSGVSADAGPVRFALGSRGEGRLLLPISGSERVPRIPETPTLKISDEIYSFGSDSWRFLDLTCLAPELDGVFGEVADEIVKRIASGDGALKACVATLGEFRMLLVPKQSKVGKQEIIGLVGELLLLSELLELDPDACSLWRGPLGERHDFRAGKLSIEVKTSSRAANEVMHVTSIDQLLEPSGGELCLVRYTLEESSSGDISVGSIFSVLSGKVSDPMQLRNLLARLDCPDPRSDDWNSSSFNLEEIRSYSITDEFPRLVPKSLVTGGLPAGVGCVEYEVDLAAARHAMMSSEDRQEYQRRMILCLQSA